MRVGGDAELEVSPKLKEIVFEQICVHFLAGASLKARDLFRIGSLMDPYIPSVVNAEGRLDDPALSDKSIRARLEKALEDWPHASATTAQDDRSVRSVLTGKKVLLVMRKYSLSSSDSREHELAIFFRQSAVALGMDTTEFAAEPFLNPRSVTPDEQYAALDRLIRLILETRPDLVVFDNLGCADHRDGYLDRPSYRAIFEHLKSIHRFRLAVFYCDSWTEESVQAIEEIRDVADVVWRQNSAISEKDHLGKCGKGGLFHSVIPYPDELFTSGGGEKSLGAVFLGSVFAYNYPRAI